MATAIDDAVTQSPGAGPSRWTILKEEEEDRAIFMKRKQQYKDLERNIESSNELLDSLASYLSTFQTDLSAVSGQVADLQNRSAEIENELNGRKSLLPTLNALLSDITLPPAIVLTLRDTQPAQNPDLWLSAIIQLDEKIMKCRSLSSTSTAMPPTSASSQNINHIDSPSTPRSSTTPLPPSSSSTEHAPSSSRPVLAAQEMNSILEGLLLRSLHLLPPFLLSLIKPLRSPSKGLSTNLAVLQTSLLLKYQPFYAFLLRHSPRMAKTVERGYVIAARSYYETAFRRYTRALGTVRSRGVAVGSHSAASHATGRGAAQGPGAGQGQGPTSGQGSAANGDRNQTAPTAEDSGLKYALSPEEGGGGEVVLIFQAEDKDFLMPIEGLFRSMCLVLLDNASAEFTFLMRFFSRAKLSVHSTSLANPPASVPGSVPGGGGGIDSHPHTDPPSASASAIGRPPSTPIDLSSSTSRAERSERSDPSIAEANRLWTETFSTALESCESFFSSLLPPSLPIGAPNLLALIRINDKVISIAESRGAIPLGAYLQKQRLALWPLFRKEMDVKVESLKKVADDAEGKGLAGYVGMVGRGVRDSAVRDKARDYAALVGVCARLGDEKDEMMVFGSLTRLRAELVRLITAQSNKLKSPNDRNSFLSAMYELVMHELVASVGHMTHPRMQSEVSFFRTREEEAGRRGGA